MTTIYILELENGKFYVGKTNKFDVRMANHLTSNGSSWTKMHKVVRVYGTYPSNDPFEEDTYTLKMMDKFGINNVRGGSYCQLELPSQELKSIKQKIAGATDACLRCFNVGHFLSNCISHRDKYGDPVEVVTSSVGNLALPNNHTTTNIFTVAAVAQNKAQQLSRQQTPLYNAVYLSPNTTTLTLPLPAQNQTLKLFNQDADVCFRCGRDSHSAQDCYAGKHIDGRRLSDDITVTSKIAPLPVPVPVPVPSPQKQAKKRTNNDADVCFRCGRDSHWLEDCFAGTHVDGGKLSSESDGSKKRQKQTPTVATASMPAVKTPTAREFSSIKGSNNTSSSKKVCSRCGRDTHTKASCYATVHAKGYDLYY